MFLFTGSLAISSVVLAGAEYLCARSGKLDVRSWKV